jgi:hypothetical protein
MPLTDTAIKNAKPTDKPYKMQDEKGMYLLVHSNGSKYFRYDYRFAGKRKKLALGAYPVTSLKEARDKRDTAKKQIEGRLQTQATHEKQQKPSNRPRLKTKAAWMQNSFEHIARDWLASIEHTVRDITHQKKISRLELHVFPVIGGIAKGKWNGRTSI